MPVLGVVVYTLLQPRRYRAEAVLIRTDRPTSTPARGEGDMALLMAAETFNQHRKSMLDRAVDLMPKEGGVPYAIPDAVELARISTARHSGGSRELSVTVVMASPRGMRDDAAYSRRVADAANALSMAIKEEMRTERDLAIERARDGIRKRMDDYAERLRASNAAILAHRAKLSPQGSEIPPLQSEVEKSMARLAELDRSKQLSDFQANELGERLKQLDAAISRQVELSSATEGYFTDLDVKDLRAALLKAEMELANAEIRYQPTHPVLQKLQRERDALRAKLAERAASKDPGRAADLGRLQLQRDMVDAELAGVSARLAAIDDAWKKEKQELDKAIEKIEKSGADPFSDLLRQHEMVSATMDALQKEMERIDRDETWGALPELAILRAAEPPGAAYSPKWTVNLAVGLGLAMLLVLAAAFVAENMEDRIRDQRDLMQHFNLPFLGPVPLWREGEGTIINLDHPRSVLADVFGVLRNNIGYALPPDAPKTLLVASSIVGEGKSTIAANLAISYCLDGNNVLLVDTDLRRPKAHRLMESLCPNATTSQGLTAFLSGRATMEQILFPASVPGLSIIAAGHGAINPSKLLGSAEMKKLMAELVKAFDVIILDGPAVLPVVDSTVVTSLVSGVLLVVSSKRAPAEQIGTAIARLDHVKAPIIGMVLNRQPGGSRGYYHYYGSRYGYGYGYGYSYHAGEGDG